MAKTVTVELTLKDTQILRRLIIEEAKRLGYDGYQRLSEQPPNLRRLNTVANKIWEARQSFDGPR
jgi:hypothetical protein